jgi:hypothetical protein
MVSYVILEIDPVQAEWEELNARCAAILDEVDRVPSSRSTYELWGEYRFLYYRVLEIEKKFSRAVE